MVAVPMWALSHQGRLGKGNLFTSTLVIQIDPHIILDETMTSLKHHSVHSDEPLGKSPLPA